MSGLFKVIIAVLAGALALSPLTPALALEPVDDFGPNPGALEAFLHRPANAAPGMPMVVALRGCTQSARDFDAETGLVALADETPFLLLLPQQRAENMGRLCFRWHDTDDNQAGRGESASILQMIDAVIAAEDVDPDRVYVMGLSAGGGMAAVMLANYPDRFAGGAIIAGPPYGCNRSVNAFDWYWTMLHHSPFALDGADAAYACGLFTSPATDRNPAEWAEFVLDAAQLIPDEWPPVSLWMGANDDVVDPDNLRELTEQWTAVHGIDLIADEEHSVGDATRRVYFDAEGMPKVEAWDVGTLGHAVPVDPDSDTFPCGEVGEHMTDVNLCAVELITEFWNLK
ncbi:MAG: PHB depolymerase family esterase [Pseudomonadota bacterium]